MLYHIEHTALTAFCAACALLKACIISIAIDEHGEYDANVLHCGNAAAIKFNALFAPVSQPIDPDPLGDEAYPIRPASHGLTNDAIVGVLHYQDYL